MPVVTMSEARAGLHRLVKAVECGAEKEIIIARNGRPAASLVPIAATRETGQRIGLLKGKIVVPLDFDAHSDEIARLFLGSRKD